MRNVQADILLEYWFSKFNYNSAVHRRSIPTENKSQSQQTLPPGRKWSNIVFHLWGEEGFHPQSVKIFPCGGWTWPRCDPWSARRSLATSNITATTKVHYRGEVFNTWPAKWKNSRFQFSFSRWKQQTKCYQAAGIDLWFCIFKSIRYWLP